MNQKKFSFIICTNDSEYFEECMAYIDRLFVPEGYEVEVLGITEASSMTSGYTEGMEASDAAYKIYMHQDVFILYPRFLESVLEIFESDKNIGMIGMVGTPEMSPDGVMWNGYRVGNLYRVQPERMQYPVKQGYAEYQYALEDGLHEVQAVDGLMVITSQDIPWRTDILDGWDYYDVSQSFEMLRKGYKVVVPEQRMPWCLHDDGILNLRMYDKYRKISMREYKEFFEKD